MIIETYEDWWDAVETQWDNLINILRHHLDLDSPAFEAPGQSDSLMTGRDIYNELIFLKENKDPKLARYFHGVWWLASEAYARERVPGWLAMCDLCSEDYVLNEGEGDENHAKI